MNGTNNFIAEYFNLEQTHRAHAANLLAMCLEYWASERDYELKSQLLNDLVLKYASAIRNLVELNQLKNKFLGIAAHDLRNPLISIRGLSEIILSEATGPLTPEQQEYLTIINGVSNSMLTLVNDLLDISVIESGRLELRRSLYSLCKLVKERIRIHRILAEEKGISIHEDLCNVPDQVFDQSKVAQVVDNLLSNAIKYSHRDSRIWVKIELEDQVVRVGVTDQGPGIPEQHQQEIFGEFQHLKARPTGGEKSTGLGLAIAKRIVEAHGGTLSLKSRVDTGSTFSFTIPLEDMDDSRQETKGHDCR